MPTNERAPLLEGSRQIASAEAQAYFNHVALERGIAQQEVTGMEEGTYTLSQRDTVDLMADLFENLQRDLLDEQADTSPVPHTQASHEFVSRTLQALSSTVDLIRTGRDEDFKLKKGH